LAEGLLGDDGTRFAKAWNFGPDARGDATVAEVAAAMARCWGQGACVEHVPLPDHPHEAGLLRLDSTQARHELDWQPHWSLPHALEQTVAWHRAWLRGADMTAFSLEQISAYEAGSQP
jgi:CDP-glucose 4,6-dehydratase